MTKQILIDSVCVISGLAVVFFVLPWIGSKIADLLFRKR